jgi:hypothetical protein
MNEGSSKGGYKHRYFVKGQRNLCQLISRNSNGDGAPADSVEFCSSSPSLGERARKGESSLAPLAEAATSLLTAKALSSEESISPNVATISVGNVSSSSAIDSGCSENSDEEATRKDDPPYNAHLHKEWNKEFQFPWRLYEMLLRSETDSFEHVVSWQPGDACFKVHEPSIFVSVVLPRFFKQTKYKSFQRVSTRGILYG